MSPHHDLTEFPTPTAADYYQQKFQQAVAEMARQRTRAEQLEVELAECREQLTEAERWIQAKCTIAGCWKSKYQETKAELERLWAVIQEALGFTAQACPGSPCTKLRPDSLCRACQFLARPEVKRLLEKPDGPCPLNHEHGYHCVGLMDFGFTVEKPDA